ncbi:MAG: lipoyl(octanoyl) transferase LipB [Candidatus Binatia bacterium]
MASLLYKDLSRMSFPDALRLQEKLVGLKAKDCDADIVLLVEHPHVYTLGRGGNADHVLAPQEVPVYRTSRGGDVTYHGPGQFVIYPILDLRSKLRKDVHRYVRNLEQSTIRTLADFGITAIRRPPYTGIWITDRKIAAIGIAVRRAITYHGLALNVNVDLSYFKRIVPCGLAWADVTSMEKELGTELNLVEVRDRFLHHFAELFGYTETKESEELFDLRAVQTGGSEEASESTIGTTGTF